MYEGINCLAGEGCRKFESYLTDGIRFVLSGEGIGLTAVKMILKGIVSKAGKNAGKGAKGAAAAEVARGAPWSSTKSKSPVANAFDHYNQKFLNSPPKGTLIKVRSNGDTLFFYIIQKAIPLESRMRMVRRVRCFDLRMVWIIGTSSR